MTVAVPNSASTKVLSKVTSGVLSHAVWFQNFNTTTGVRVACGAEADGAEFYVPPAGSATAPASLIVQNTGGDSTLVNAEWYAWQNSGVSVNINCGRW